MKLGFNLISILIAIVFMFFDYSISLGIILALFAKEVIATLRKQMQSNVLSASTLDSKIIFKHFFLVLLIMITTLSISFFYRDFFNPIAVGAVFIVDRLFFYVSQSKVDGSI